MSRSLSCRRRTRQCHRALDAAAGHRPIGRSGHRYSAVRTTGASGEPDSPPALPPFALADGTAPLATAFAVMVALRDRDRTSRLLTIDMAIIEPIVMMLGAQITANDQLGMTQPRTGNRSPNHADARATVAALEAVVAQGRGIATTESGSMVDAAMHRQAERVVAFDRS